MRRGLRSIRHHRRDMCSRIYCDLYLYCIVKNRVRQSIYTYGINTHKQYTKTNIIDILYSYTHPTNPMHVYTRLIHIYIYSTRMHGYSVHTVYHVPILVTITSWSYSLSSPPLINTPIETNLPITYNMYNMSLG